MLDAPREVTRNAAGSNGSIVKRTHPMIIVAAGAVTVAAAIGVGVMTGLIPSAQSGGGSTNPQTASSAPLTPMVAGAVQSASGNLTEAALPATAEPKPATAPAVKKPPAAARAPVQSTAANPTPTYTPTASTPASSSERSSVNTPTPPPAVAKAVCANCGSVESVTTVTREGSGSGAGAVIGGVVGGLLGHQVGGGRGKDVATVAGAVGGAVLGNQLEKNKNAAQEFDIRVRLDDGTSQTIRSQTDPGLRNGDKVRVQDGRLTRI